MGKFLKFNPVLSKFSNTHASLVYSLQPILQQIQFGINFVGNESKHQNQCVHSELNSCGLKRGELR